MKAQMLKLAGVKTEKEFYKKFPTEEAFMKKHGHKLRKAALGIGLDDEEEDETSKAPTPVKVSTNNSGPITSLIPGLEGFGGVNAFIEKQSDGTYYSAMEDKSYNPEVAKEQMASSEYVASIDPNMKSSDDSLDAISNSIGTALGSYMTAKGAMDDAKKNKVYGEIASLMQKGANMPKQPGRSNVLRPEYQTISPDQLTPALGTGTQYLAAKNGGKFSSGEIANNYDPGDLYQDLGYAEDEELQKADFGALMGTVGKVAGKVPTGLAGAIGSKIGGGNFQASPESQVGGAAGEVVGDVATAITGIPLLGKLGKIGGEAITGAIFAPQVRQRELDQNKLITSELALAQNNFQQANDSFMKDGGHVSDFGYMSDTWNPQVITKFGDMDVSQIHTFAQQGMPQYRAGGHLTEYTPPSASAMYTGRDLPYQMDDGGVMHSTNMMFDTDRHPRAENGRKMAMGGDLEVEQGAIQTLAHNPELGNGGDIIKFNGPSHENGGMDTRFGNQKVNVEGDETGFSGANGEFNVLGNMKVSKFAAQQIGNEKFANMKYKQIGKIVGADQSKQNKMIAKSTDAIDSLNPSNPFDQLAMNAHMLNIKAGKEKTSKNAATLKMAGMVQNSILDAAEEHGLDPAALAEYKIKKVNKKDMYAEFGTKLKIARNGIKMDNGGKAEHKFKQFEEEATKELNKNRPQLGGEYKIVPLTGGVYNKKGGRDISTQAGIYKKGHSQTPVSLHNFDAARDYRIYYKDSYSNKWEMLDPSWDPTYADVLWPVAERLGMHHVGDNDPKTKEGNWDPAHIGLVKEGQGTAYKELTKNYPEIFSNPNAKKTVQWIIKNKDSDPEIKRHYKMLTEAQPTATKIKEVIGTVSEALDKVLPEMPKLPSFNATEWAAKAVGEFIGATNEMNQAMPTPNKAKAAIRTPEVPSFRFQPDYEDAPVENPVGTPAAAAAPQYKVRPKGDPRSAVAQTSPTSGVVKSGVSAEWEKYLSPRLNPPIDLTQRDSWTEEKTPFWKYDSNIKLGQTPDFPNQKNRLSLLGKDYDPGYNEQPFWKARTDVPYVPKPAASQAVPVNPLSSTTATTPAKGAAPKGAVKGKGKGVAAAVAAAAKPAQRTVPGQNYLTDGSMPPEEQANGVNQAMLSSVAPDTDPNNALNLQPVAGDYSGSKSPGTSATAKGDTRLGKFFDSLLSNAAPFLRPTNQLGLDPAQISSEMLALSNNAVEPVFAQTYQPMLTQPIDVSYQDQLNEVTAQSRAAERLTQGNPALQANIFAQSAEAKNKILAEQFRANQAEKLRAYETNRQTLNDAQMKNLAILDQQYQRQAQAKSNTKAQTFAAINSISDKLAKNKLENKTLATYENMYNYRFTPQGVAYNVNGPQNFNIPTVGTGADDADSIIANLDKQKELIDAAKAKLTKTAKAANGGIVKAIHSL